MNSLKYGSQTGLRIHFIFGFQVVAKQECWNWNLILPNEMRRGMLFHFISWKNAHLGTSLYPTHICTPPPPLLILAKPRCTSTVTTIITTKREREIEQANSTATEHGVMARGGAVRLVDLERQCRCPDIDLRGDTPPRSLPPLHVGIRPPPARLSLVTSPKVRLFRPSLLLANDELVCRCSNILRALMNGYVLLVFPWVTQEFKSGGEHSYVCVLYWSYSVIVECVMLLRSDL